ncbi:YggS family pyridoxal phosphate-dependent enzyme [Candidatus Pelagibacter sp.]|nr:YggS family pyridoxal phosphate-dependent enzyme [Candidatus Pelagibacter sp.]
MHSSIKNYEDIIRSIKLKLEDQNTSKLPKIIAVSKTFALDNILPLVEYGHLDYGENKVQEAIDKWSEIKIKKPQIKLHLIGKLQTNKVKFAIRIFDYIHSVDSIKLAKKISDEQKKQNKKVKIFIQVNIGSEEQKSGADINKIEELLNFCKELELDVIGLMCIPPINKDSSKYFQKMSLLKNDFNLQQLSMGMSSDYLDAIKNNATYLRIGSSIFGKRS